MDTRIATGPPLRAQHFNRINISLSTLCHRRMFHPQSCTIQSSRQSRAGTVCTLGRPAGIGKVSRKLRSYSSNAGQGSTASEEEEEPDDNDESEDEFDDEEGPDDEEETGVDESEKELTLAELSKGGYDLEKIVEELMNPKPEGASEDGNENELPFAVPLVSDFPEETFLCTSITAPTVSDAVKEIQEAAELGADLVELRLDYLEDLDLKSPEEALETLYQACEDSDVLPITTFRPKYEGGKYDGGDAPRMAVLKYAAMVGCPFVDVEFRVSSLFFGSEGQIPPGTKIILSEHDYKETPDFKTLLALRNEMFNAGADIVKIATMAKTDFDAMNLLLLTQDSPGPVIALAMGEKGLVSRLLAPVFGSVVTFGALSKGRESAPGQPTLEEMRDLYRLHLLNRETQVMGILGNPVGHSRSPLIHNTALAEDNFNAVYVPVLVENLEEFLAAYQTPDFRGWSVTIPHKVEAMRLADSLDPLAERIGAVNTLVRQEDGTLKGYNTDCQAAVAAIEEGLTRKSGSGKVAESPLKDRRVVVLGAGGAGRALAFGAADKGAHVIIANRTLEKAEELAEAVGSGAEAVSLAAIESGEVGGDVLVNTTSIGMTPDVDATPVPRSALGGYRLVFDAVYTPMETRLLKEAREEGCVVVSGVEMFIGQALEQYRLLTREEPPEGLMRRVVFKSLMSS
eukprot:jgi/Botrbrau1/20048/Bobra.200_1s0053.1